MQKRTRAVIMPGAVAVLMVLVAAASVPVLADGSTDYYGQAEEAYEAGDFAAAKLLYQQFYNERGAINITPGQRSLNTHVLMRLGRCCHNLTQFAEARDWYGKVIADYPADTGACSGAQYETGIAYAKDGLKYLAHEALEKVITDYPNERGMGAYALLKKAKIDCRPSRYDEAIITLERLISDYSDKKGVCKQAKWLLADALDQNFRTDDALMVLNGIYGDAESSFDEKGDALVKMANFRIHASRWSDCRATCDRLLEEYAESKSHKASAKVALAQAMCMQGFDPDRALKLIEELREIPWYRQPSRQALFALWTGGCYWLKGDRAKAEEWLAKVINDYSDHPGLVGDAYYHRARLRAEAKDYDNAATDIGKIHLPYLQHFARGEWYYAQQNYAAAAVEYELVIETLPEHRVPNIEPVLAFRRMAACYSKLADESKAEDARARLAAFEATHK